MITSTLNIGLFAVDSLPLFEGITETTTSLLPSTGHVITGSKELSHQYPTVTGESETTCQFPPLGFGISTVDSVP